MSINIRNYVHSINNKKKKKYINENILKDKICIKLRKS